MFDRVLVANRGEIAARILSTLREMGIEGIAVYASQDASQPHVHMAEHAVDLGSGPPASTYLDGERLVEIANQMGCQAIHPGYGFLSENAAFARQVQDGGLTWIGPPPEAIALLGDKAKALALAGELGVPTTPGSNGSVDTVQQARETIEQIGLPSVIKAVHGGGGMGMVKVENLDEVDDAWTAAREQAQNAFGSPEVLVERWWEAPRHLEVQVAFDQQGDGVHLFERECSLQRRNQKLVEEAPAPNLDEATRDRLTNHALLLSQAAGVENLATVEFLLTEDGHVFNEVNPRLQVEHTVTEQTTHTDLVAWQLHLAHGDPLPKSQDEIEPNGWAIEARVNAEDPLDQFQPAPGPISHVHVPQGEGIRVDHALVPGGTVSASFDSLVAKIIGYGPTRNDAINRCRTALAQLRVGQRPTTAGFLYQLLDHPRVRQGDMDTNLVDAATIQAYRETVYGAMACLIDANPLDEEGTITLDGHTAAWTRTGARIQINGTPAKPRGERVANGRVEIDDRTLEGQVRPAKATATQHAAEGERVLESPIAGTVDEILAQPGDAVDAGTELIVIEAMKMKNRIGAQGPGVIGEILTQPGETVQKGDPLIRIEDPDA